MGVLQDHCLRIDKCEARRAWVRSRPSAIAGGRLKSVVDSATREILGFHVLAPHGDNLLHEAVAAMYDEGTIERIGKSIHIHPTLSETAPWPVPLNISTTGHFREIPTDTIRHCLHCLDPLQTWTVDGLRAAAQALC